MMSKCLLTSSQLRQSPGLEIDLDVDNDDDDDDNIAERCK